MRGGISILAWGLAHALGLGVRWGLLSPGRALAACADMAERA